MHEFVELYNEEEVDIDVSYWRIVAEVRTVDTLGIIGVKLVCLLIPLLGRF